MGLFYTMRMFERSYFPGTMRSIDKYFSGHFDLTDMLSIWRMYPNCRMQILWNHPRSCSFEIGSNWRCDCSISGRDMSADPDTAYSLRSARYVSSTGILPPSDVDQYLYFEMQDLRKQVSALRKELAEIKK